MARYHGIEGNTYDNLILDSGAIYINYVNAGDPGTLLGATRGGATFKRAPSYIETPYEGIAGQVVGEKHLADVKVSLEVNILSFVRNHLVHAIPNADATYPGGNFSVITEKAWDAVGVHTLTNIAILAQHSGFNTPIAIVLDNPISEKDLSFNFKDKNEVVSKWVFSAYYDETVGFDDPPWRIYWPQTPT